MSKFSAALCIALLGLVGCQQSPEPSTPADTVATAPSTAPETAPVAETKAPTFWDRLDSVLAGSHRSEANRARDAYRHPKETLQFFDLQPNTTVIEITPGAGWYTEILGPLLKDQGKLIAVLIDPASVRDQRASAYYQKLNDEFRAKVADTAVYGPIEVIAVNGDKPHLGEPNSVDSVVTFRNVHNWTQAGTDAAMFQAFFEVLKPGGWLGVEEHRAKPGTSVAQAKKTGYLPEKYVIELAEKAGFVLLAKSEINANPNDTADHPNGVWTLPPTLNVPKGQDPAKYQAIGESDRMTLRFLKPKNAGAQPTANP